MNTDALTQLVISALEDVKGQDITVLDVPALEAFSERDAAD